MIAYAGIGSRKITPEEENLIHKIAEKMASLGIIAYSGNAEGSDIAFQTGSNGNCVLLLPWKKFNNNAYDVTKALANYDVGKSPEGLATIAKYHPAPQNLSYGGKLMMGRNWHQIVGYDIFPKVSFVICCANENESGIIGGTGQACRIATDLGIPVFNIRKDWDSQKDKLKELVKELLGKENG
jgi:hypothetical protein